MSQFKDLAEQIFEILNEINHEHRMVLFGDSNRFKLWLENQQVNDLNPIAAFDRYLNNNKDKDICKKIFLSWKDRGQVKIYPKDLKKVNKRLNDFTVDHKLDLAKKYLEKFVTCANIEKEKDLVIIDEHQSVILKCKDKIVGAVIRNAAKENVANHFGIKMKLTVDAHLKINRSKKTHASSGKLAAHGTRAEFKKPSTTGLYVYKEKNLDPEAQKIYDQNGDEFGKWIYEYAKDYLPWAVVSYEEFKKKVNMEDDKLIGAVFCAENYEAAGHRDEDQSEFAVGFVYEIGIVKEGYFIYPEYGIAIKLTSNSIWCWQTQAVHGTARLNLDEGGVRYTSAITLTKKTAKAIEKEAGIIET